MLLNLLKFAEYHKINLDAIPFTLFNGSCYIGEFTAWKVSKYLVISGSYFPVFSPNTGKYGPEITPYLDSFHAVIYCRRASYVYSKACQAYKMEQFLKIVNEF